MIARRQRRKGDGRGKWRWALYLAATGQMATKDNSNRHYPALIQRQKAYSLHRRLRARPTVVATEVRQPEIIGSLDMLSVCHLFGALRDVFTRVNIHSQAYPLCFSRRDVVFQHFLLASPFFRWRPPTISLTLMLCVERP
jgi:hypothetical protein